LPFNYVLKTAAKSDNFCCYVCMSLTKRTTIHMYQHCSWWYVYVLLWELCAFYCFCSIWRTLLLFLCSIL